MAVGQVSEHTWFTWFIKTKLTYIVYEIEKWGKGLVCFHEGNFILTNAYMVTPMTS